MYPAVEIVPCKRNMGAGFFDSEHDLTFDPSSADKRPVEDEADELTPGGAVRWVARRVG